MTNIDIYVMISKTTGQAKDFKERFISNEAYKRITKMTETKMAELHTDLKKIADYFIELFKLTGGKYSCSRTKLGKLISIVAFVYAIKGEKLLDEKIYKYKSDVLDEFCGTTIQELILLVGRDAYTPQRKCDKDNNTKISDGNTKIPFEDLKGQEKILTPLSEDLKTCIEDVFLNFGAYDPKKLGDCINPIILYEGIILEDNSINLQKLSQLFKRDFEGFNYISNSNGIQKDLVDYLLSSSNN